MNISYASRINILYWLFLLIVLGVICFQGKTAESSEVLIREHQLSTDIYLGQAKQDIVSSFGAPENIKSEGLVYAYESLGISVFFDEREQVKLIYLGSNFQGTLNGVSLNNLTLEKAQQQFGGTDLGQKRVYTPSVMIQTKSTAETELIETENILPLEYRGKKVLYELLAHGMIMKYKYVLDDQGLAYWFDHNQNLYTTVVYYPQDAKPKPAMQEAKECVICFEDVLEIVFFEFDKCAIQPEHVRILEKHVQLLKSHPQVGLLIQGHTDSKGTKEYNMELSNNRAKSVHDYFVQRGISSDKLQTEGYGFSRPIAPNVTEDGGDNPEGRALNRRAEMRFTTSN